MKNRKIVQIIVVYMMIIFVLGTFNEVSFGVQKIKIKPNKNRLEVVPKSNSNPTIIKSQNSKQTQKKVNKVINNNQIPASTEVNKSAEVRKAKVTNVNSSLRIRKDADLASAVMGAAINGQVVDIIGEQGDWYKIKYNNGSGSGYGSGYGIGYVSKQYLTVIGDKQPASEVVSKTENLEEVVPENVTTPSAIDNNIGSVEFQNVFNVMQQQVGTPYIYGGSGEIITTALMDTFKNKYPKYAVSGDYDISQDYFDKDYRAFDCSGFMQWGFKQVGVVIGRSTKDQINNGVETLLNSIKPGDLLFYSDLSHVGMYIGNDKWIEAPNPRSVVRIVNIPWNKISRARRVLVEVAQGSN